MRTSKPFVSVALSLVFVAGCKTSKPASDVPPERAPEVPVVVKESVRVGDDKPLGGGDEIVICGKRVSTGAPVVLWVDLPRYDASSEEPRFSQLSDDSKKPRGRRYQPGRVQKIPNPRFVAAPEDGMADERSDLEKVETLSEAVVPRDCRDPKLAAEVIDQFVLHFDVCGLSRTCFRVLQDERGLSVHFMIDIDGTIYQTIDVRDTTWHATKANSRSIGVEIANMGAYVPGRASALDEWYARDAKGVYIKIPERIHDTGLRQLGFVGRPARDARVRGVIQGDELEQYDYTPEQYKSLVRLTAALCRELPKLKPDAPRDEHGVVTNHVLSDAEWQSFQGILGHYHVQKNKNDPGPAFNWEPFLADVKKRMAELDLPPRP